MPKKPKTKHPQQSGTEKWFKLSAEQTATKLGVDPTQGLSTSEAQTRLQKYGSNVLESKKKESGLHAFARQYRDFMQIILVAAAIISLIVTAKLGTSVALFGLTVFNALMGLKQEAKAQASLESLQKMMKNVAQVRRNGQITKVEEEKLVPGDIVLIEAGDRVPADGRLFVAASLEVEEAALTGESVASPKNTETIMAPDAALGDRHCMVYMNTSVTRGRGELIVTTTGMGTEMGRIAELLNKTKAEKTPLQKQLDKLTLIIAGIAGITFVLMVILGLRQGQAFETLFMAGVALAIAAIPTGMPVVVTTLYSEGTRVLASHNAIVKRLPSVETLGSVSAICSDKTGTLTLNKMTVREFSIPGKNHYRVTGEGYSTQGQLLHDGGAKIDLDEILLPMALCADATLEGNNLIGDPTEGALIVLAEKGGISVEGARKNYPRIAEVPFDSEYKFMATFHNLTDDQGKPVVRAFIKGAPDVLIARSSNYWTPGGKIFPITEQNRSVAVEENERMAKAGERVIIVGRKDFNPQAFDPHAKLLDLMKDITLLSIVGMVDPPRVEAKDSIAKCHRAGIQVRMITGDYATTAAVIGEELGIRGKALSGAQFSAMKDEELEKEVDHIGVIARVAPEDKLRLVSLLQKKCNIVAMTGDGVNDAPALKKADIGVAMGITGTEVSKDAAVMILTDDNFATIVGAVEYGRGIYDNLVKYIRYQMGTLVAFIATFLGAAFFSILGGTPFGPLTVLWINFLVQVPIAIALGFDDPSPGLMKRKPRPLSEPVLSLHRWIRIIFMGLIIAVATLFIEGYYSGIADNQAITMGYAVFSLLSIALGITSRSEIETIFSKDLLPSGRQLGLYIVALVFLFVGAGLLRDISNTTPLTSEQWLICFAFAGLLILVDEITKFFMRRTRKR
ncbi:MAG: cation-translocating P-type ATPase [Candidatus Bathyarchaeota archaeon]|nr:cation-translocating P-type ATPase [Candidatus Bathyarchaeota archaeon]